MKGVWALGLHAQASARRASKWGGIALWLQAARMTIGNFLGVIAADKSIGSAIAWMIGASILPIIIAIAGVILWRGTGWMLAGLSALALIADLAVYGPMIPPNTIFTLLVRIALLIVILNGVRGALALKKFDYSK